MLIEMKNGGLIDIREDNEQYSGCETCDYGSSYINEIDFFLVGGKLRVKSTNMYEYALSDGQVLKTILPNVDKIKEMTEEEFVGWLEEEFKKVVSSDSLEFNFIKSSWK